MSILSYDRLEKHLGLAADEELRIARLWIFKAESEKVILDRHGVVRCCATPSVSLSDFKIRRKSQDISTRALFEEFVDRCAKTWMRSSEPC